MCENRDNLKNALDNILKKQEVEFICGKYGKYNLLNRLRHKLNKRIISMKDNTYIMSHKGWFLLTNVTELSHESTFCSLCESTNWGIRLGCKNCGMENVLYGFTTLNGIFIPIEKLKELTQSGKKFVMLDEKRKYTYLAAEDAAT